MPDKTLAGEFIKGLWDENPVFRQLLGMCPTLAVTNALLNGLAMGLAVTFVLVSSAILVSLVRKLIPNQVRIASFILIIATFVTISDRFMAAFFPALSKSLGPYVPLIVVNCIILGRAEAFGSKNPIGRSIIDALGMSLGFLLSLLVLSGVRELLGSGSLFGHRVLGAWFEPWVVMLLPPGAFLSLGILIAASLFVEARIKKRRVS